MHNQLRNHFKRTQYGPHFEVYFNLLYTVYSVNSQGLLFRRIPAAPLHLRTLSPLPPTTTKIPNCILPLFGTDAIATCCALNMLLCSYCQFSGRDNHFRMCNPLPLFPQVVF